MQPWVRRGVGGALLLCLAGFMLVFVRLDDAALRRQVIEQLEQATGRTVHGGKAALSLQHGVSLNILQLGIDGKGGEWTLETDAMRFNISLWSLLVGNLHIASVDMIHPVLHLNKSVSPGALFTSPFAGRLLQGASVISLRQGRILLRERVLADEVDATVRRVDREQQTSWEVQSRYAGGDFSSQGYVRSTNSGHSKVFGRITATQLQLAQIQSLPFSSLHYDLLDASLTFSLDDGRLWEWSGNMLARDRHGELPELSWRGKIGGRSTNDFTMHDTFIQFGGKTRLALSGGCQSDLMCKVGVETRGADAGLILKALGVDAPLQGRLDGKLAIEQERPGWKLDGKLGLHAMTWASTALPDSTVKLADMLVTQAGTYSIGRADIRPGGGEGSIGLDHVWRNADGFHMGVRLDGVDGAWVPLGNIFLRRSELFSKLLQAKSLDGKGVISGAMDWISVGDESHLHFSLAADKAAIALGKTFAKPAGIVAEASGDYRRQAGKWWLDVSGLHLGDSRLNSLNLDMSTPSPRFSFAGAALNLNVLKAQGVVLPQPLDAWTGKLGGGLKDVVLHKGGGLRQDLGAADGKLHLDGFGRDGQLLNGDVDLQHGTALASGMRWQHGSSFADFDVDMNLLELHGRLNINRAGFQWSPQDSLPAWLMDVDMRGKFGQADLQWSGNAWKDMQGQFVAHRGHVVLDHVRGRLGHGEVRSRSMDLDAIPDGIRFSGRLGMIAVHLDELDGLVDAIGAKPTGYAFVNASLSGVLPMSSMPKGEGWQGNGDVEIQKGSMQGAETDHSIYWQNDAAEKLLNASGQGFDLLACRFRFHDSELKLEHMEIGKGKTRATGEASVNAEGKISGRLIVNREKLSRQSALGGNWPSAARLLSASGAAH